ncbi:MAG: GrpB family protein [Nanoarchaeota archaeon]
MTINKYKYKKYSKTYPTLFKKEKSKLTKVIPNLEIEHVGSTSIPGLGGKGIIDIAIKTPVKEVNKIIKKLEILSYKTTPNHPKTSTSIFLQKIVRSQGKERRIHIHLTLTNTFWNSFILFRDYLRIHNKEKEAYAKIKKQASLYAKGEAEKYRVYKKSLLEKIMKKALKENKK